HVLLLLTGRFRGKMPDLFGQSKQGFRKGPPSHAQTDGFLPHNCHGWDGGAEPHLSGTTGRSVGGGGVPVDQASSAFSRLRPGRGGQIAGPFLPTRKGDN